MTSSEHYYSPISTTQSSTCSSPCESESSPEDSLMEDEDALSLTSSSYSTPNYTRKKYYPRGIINPNYPGFQHLAHKLAEHFVNHQFDHDDSDLSEFEIELNVESLDGSFNKFEYSNDNNNIENINNNNNSNDDNIYRNSYLEIPSKDMSLQDEVNLNLNETNEVTISRKNNEQMSSLESLDELSDNRYKHLECQDEIRNCPTPDILIKNDNLRFRKKSSISKPDLLRHVNLSSNCNNDLNKPADNLFASQKCMEPAENSYEGTPIDIIGDFGREVEHEFGIIVSEFNSSLTFRDGSPVTEVNKITDAILSNGKEKLTISPKFSLAIESHIPAAKAIICDHTLSGYQNKKATQQPPTHLIQSLNENHQTDLEVKNSISCNQNSMNSLDKLIPTAIVKPKYQKRSYDDRQLPPIGFGYFKSDRAWFDDKTNNQMDWIESSSNNNKALDIVSEHILLNTQKNLVKNNCVQKYTKKYFSNSSSSVSNDQLKNMKSAIAVVTPRKKEKIETNEIKNNSHILEKESSQCQKNYYNNNYAKESAVKSYDLLNKNDKYNLKITENFDVYNIETALPVIDLEAIENHLKKAKEKEQKRRNDREEIRRRLAMGAEDDYFSKIVPADRPGRKPSLQSRLQNGRNLQICFMNDITSDTESPSSDSETCPKLSKASKNSSTKLRSSLISSNTNPYYSQPLSIDITENNNEKITQISKRPTTLPLGPSTNENLQESDFFTKQARLQIEARMALAQAKDMAHMQMQIERQKQKLSPITEIIRNSLEKVGVPFPIEKRRVSRQILTEMNIAQLQIIVNELHTQIESFNEQLVNFLMERDDLHMSQDSMLVDIEDLTRYLSAKEQTTSNHHENSNTVKNSSSIDNKKNNMGYFNISKSVNSPPVTATGVQNQNKLFRIANLVKK